MRQHKPIVPIDKTRESDTLVSLFAPFIACRVLRLAANEHAQRQGLFTLADVPAELATLAIERIPFDELDGNIQGFATGRMVAINPVAAMPAKTLLHELAHVILGHTAEGNLNDGSERTPRSLREVEAECVALLCCESLGLPGAHFSRGYIQSWGSEIPERSAQKIFHAADLILKAGVR